LFSKNVFLIIPLLLPTIVSKKQTIPQPPFKTLEWTFVEFITPPIKHGNSCELKCKFCAKLFKTTSIARIKKHFLGTSISIVLGNSTRNLATVERVGYKNFEAKKFGQNKNENIYK
jgi:hypothetical protein